MRNKLIRNFLIGCSIVLLSACRSDFAIDTYSSDLFVNDNVDTPAQMMVEIPSCNKKAEYEGKIIALFDASSKAKIIGCERQGMNSMLIVSISAEIASETASRDLMLFRQMGPDIEHEGKNYETRGVKPVIGPAFLERVNSLMKENMQTLSYKNISIKFSVNNDEREDILISAYTIWIDGNPHQNYRRQPIARRQKLDLQTSDVVSDLVVQGKQPVAFWIARTK